jgi:predicted Zn-dependent peptidase
VSPSVSVSKSGTAIGFEVFSSGWRTALQTLARVVQQPAFDPREVASLRSALFEEAVDSELSYSGYQSRAELALRHAGGLTYGVGAELDGSSERALLLISTQVAPGAIGAGVRKLEDEIQRLRAEPVSESELAAARSAYLGSAGGATNAGIAAAIAALYLDGGGGEDVPDFAALAEAVQPADLLRVAREYLNPRADLVVVGDVLENRKQLEALGDVKYLTVTKE